MSWNCCRTCLSSQTLNPIFYITEQSEKYTNAIFMATGIKVELNDTLPQEMCTTCINFINESIKFRKKCEQTQKTLLDKLNNGHIYDIKVESIFKIEPEKAARINITEDTDDDFKDYDDNITLDTFQYNYGVTAEKPVEKTEQIEFETRVQDIVEKPIEFIFNSQSVKKPKKRQVQKKKETEGKEKKKPERVKEEIECEYCHKILTSRLSLRNHYKIHTGFDVVCEHCGKKFITRRLLLMHCRAKHGYEKTDKCSYCDYRASNAEQVKIHERLHTGEKPYVCKECGASFHRQSSYMQHVATHLPEKTVQCDQCPARFKSVTLMKIHKGRHRPSPYTFKCRVCDNSFARRRNVARHLLKVHGLQPEEVHIVRLHVGQV